MFTDEEAKVYDRQIRLWGVQAQQQIRAADVFLVCLDGLATEIVKNLVLAGINSITILDDKPVTQFDMLSNLFSRNQIDMNRAEACQKGINELNPMVKVNIKKESLSSLLSNENDAKKFLESFNVVILVNDGLINATKLNQLCHELCIPFFFTCSWGYLSMVFIDNGRKNKFITIDEAFKNKKISLKNNNNNNQETKSENKQVLNKRELKKIEKLKNYILPIWVLFRYYEKSNQKFPILYLSSDLNEIEMELKNIEKDILNELNGNNNNDDNQIWTSTNIDDWTKKIYGQFTFISSIIGGFLSQDVIRIITNDNSIDYNISIFYDVNGYNFNIGR